MYRHDTYCGLYCDACLAMRQNKAGKLDELAARFNTTPDKVVCHGCKTDVNLSYCMNCEMKKCCRDKGYESCAECPDMPCEHILRFHDEKPHRKVIIGNLLRIREIGLPEFLNEQAKRWACPNCGYTISWYDEKCPSCGGEVFNAVKEAETIK
jgi:rubrerythrin